MWHVHSCSWFDVDLWPQGQIYWLLSCLHVRPVTSVSFDIGIPYLAHGTITMTEFDEYINHPDTTLTFDLKVKLMGFMTWLCVQALAFLSFHIDILCLTREFITMVRCVACIHELCMTLTFDLNIKIYFHHGYESGKMPFNSIDVSLLYWTLTLHVLNSFLSSPGVQYIQSSLYFVMKWWIVMKKHDYA